MNAPTSLRARVLRFFRNETGGEKDNINTLLILALIILPLVALIIFFGTKSKEAAEEKFDEVTGSPVEMP